MTSEMLEEAASSNLRLSQKQTMFLRVVLHTEGNRVQSGSVAASDHVNASAHQLSSV